MAVTLLNMGLRQWNLGTDTFSYTELASNFSAIDNHDHTTGKGLQVPTGGIVDAAITNAKLASNAVDATKIVSGSISDAKLSSPNNPVYRDLYTRTTKISGALAAGTYLFGESGTGVPVGVDSGSSVAVLYLAASDFSVGGLATRLNIRVTCTVNQTAPAQTFVIGLYPISSVGGTTSTNQRWNVGTVAGNQATFTTPAANSLSNVSAADFAIPSDGYYALGYTNSGTVATGSGVTLTARLRFHHT